MVFLRQELKDLLGDFEIETHCSIVSGCRDRLE